MGVTESEAVLVPAYPYEGALFLLLDTQALNRLGDANGYYGALYGPEAQNRIGIAASLAALFDKVAIAGADAALPDQRLYQVGETYEHPDLRVSLHQRYGEWSKESSHMLPILQSNPDIQRVWQRLAVVRNPWNQEFFLKRIVSQILLAHEHGGVLLGNRLFRRIYDIAAPVISRALGIQTLESTAWGIGFRDIEFLSLRYAIGSLEDFAAVRESKDVRSYSKSVRQIISEAVKAENVRLKLHALAKEALDSREIAQSVVRVGGDLASGSTVAGLVPVFGTVAGVVSIAADASARLGSKVVQKHDWIHVSSRMKDAVVDSRIRAASKRSVGDQ